ncbi:MAG: eCIS core domain-containing protein [Caldimonas sp.]
MRDNEAEADRAADAAGRVTGGGDAPTPATLPHAPAPRGVRSPGRPLPQAQRRSLEQAYGWDLGSLRLHDAPAERGHARAIGAAAFACGSHIVHARRGDVPERRVLAHEVAHVVQAALHPAAPSIQRYESPEHEDLGDAALDELKAFLQTPEGVEWAKKKGLDAAAVARQIEADPLKKAGGKIVVGSRAVGAAKETVALTPGEIIALSGDFYAGPDAIAGAARKPLGQAGDKNEIDQLKEAIGKERKGQLDDPNQTYESITGGRYLQLAKMNDTHFAPLNRVEWRRLHDQALAEAAAAGKDVAALNHALLVDASGGHFLTDAYASGHLFRKNELLAAIQLHLASNPLRTENPEAQTYAAIVTMSGNADQLVLKNIHDRMNHEGFEITNGRGMKWRSFGDALLAKAPDTQRIAALAVFTSRQQVYAAQRGEKPDPKEVEALMPDDATLDRATQQAIAYIPAAAADVQGLMYRGRKLAGTQFPAPLGAIIESNLATIANPGREKQLLDLEASGRDKDFGPRLAPQFTIFDFP